MIRTSESMDRVYNMLQRHEDVRLKPYDDATGLEFKPGMTLLGKLSIGTGRNLTDNGISVKENHIMLSADMWRAYNAARDTYPWFLDISYVRQDIVTSMIFNLGLPKFREFKRMITAIENRDYDLAAAEMLDSLWAQQVGARAIELAAMMRLDSYLEDISEDRANSHS